MLCLVYYYVWTLLWKNNYICIKCSLIFSCVCPVYVSISKGKKMLYRIFVIRLPRKISLSCKLCIYLHFVDSKTEVGNECTYWGETVSWHGLHGWSSLKLNVGINIFFSCAIGILLEIQVELLLPLQWSSMGKYRGKYFSVAFLLEIFRVTNSRMLRLYSHQPRL